MKSLRLATRTSRTFSILAPRPTLRLNARRAALTLTTHRHISTSFRLSLGLTPESDDPKKPNTQSTSTSHSSASPANLSDSEYHEIADQYLDTLVLALEEKAESSDSLEVEYSAGVLTITHPKGTYVLNKQPPNKQVWLSSPVSGPKRYDWVITGAGQHEKEGSEYGGGDDGQGGKWVYLRDGSDLTSLLKNEVGVEVVKEGDDASGAS